MFELVAWGFLRAIGYGWLWGREHFKNNDPGDVFGNGNDILLPLGILLHVVFFVAVILWP